MKKAFLFSILFCFSYFAFADGFISSTFSIGYTNFTQHTSPGYIFDRSGTDTLSDNLMSIAFDANFVSRIGLQLYLEILTGFNIGACAQLVPGFGIGYSFNRIKNITIGAGLMYSLFPFTIDSISSYSGDGAVGPKIEVTYWFGDIGLSALFNYYRFVITDANIISGRIGISIKR
jgi:hypothetical protein